MSGTETSLLYTPTEGAQVVAINQGNVLIGTVTERRLGHLCIQSNIGPTVEFHLYFADGWVFVPDMSGLTTHPDSAA